MNLKSKNKGSNTMVVPVRRRLRNKTPPAAAQRVPSMGLVRRRMRSKGPPPPEYSQLPVPHGSGGIPGADHSGCGPPPMIQLFQHPVIVQHSRQAYHFDLDNQMMEVMEVTQEETQGMMEKKPQSRISTYRRSDLVNHLVIQILVEMMEVEDVKADTRLPSGRNQYPSWIFPPEFIFRRRVRSSKSGNCGQ